MIEEYDRGARVLEPDYDEPAYDLDSPISICNHPPFSHMSAWELDELERSFP